MKLFVVSDVHGHCTLLKEALEQAGFNRDDPEHLLISCGDYFDRGNENIQVLQFFERLPRKVLLRGNHEDLLLKLLYTGQLLPHHYINGTVSTLQNFFGNYFVDPISDTIDFSGKTRTVDRLCDFIEQTVDYFETEHYVFVHGWLPEKGLTASGRAQASPEEWAAARWVKWIEKYRSGRPLTDKTLICGHVPTFCATGIPHYHGKDRGSIYYGDGLIAIDAGTADSKRVNVLVLQDDLQV